MRREIPDKGIWLSVLGGLLSVILVIVSFQFTHTARVTALAEAAAKEQAAQIEREARMAELDERQREREYYRQAPLEQEANATSQSKDAVADVSGFTVTGQLGMKPEISFQDPSAVKRSSFFRLQEGDGDALVNGNRICLHLTQYSLTSGEEVATTWTGDVPDCSLILDKDNLPGNVSNAAMNQIANQMLTGKKINTTFAVTGDGNSDNGQDFLLVATAVSQSKDYEVAQGATVTPPAGLPKVAATSSGKPSIDMGGYEGSKTLVSQTLIEGDGPTLDEHTYAAVVHYTGWLLDGTQFDSSWDREQPFYAVLQSMIVGWQKGLVGHSVGSRVLLVIPPDMAYGDQENGIIPPNSSLVFVVDILAKN